MPFLEKHILPFNSNWNEVPAVYGVLDVNNTVIYIGKTDNLKRRYSEHCADTYHLMHKHSPTRMVVEIIANESARTVRELQLITEYNPSCNQR